MQLNKLNFKPLLGFSSTHLQTIISSCLPSGNAPPSKHRLVELGKGDSLSCEISTPLNWNETDRTVVLIHGMGGSHSSGYMIRMAQKLYLKGNKVVRVNLRGCGSGKGLSKLPYHAGTSEDVLKVLQLLKNEAPTSEIVLIGFSLGGNIVLKLAGELGVEAGTVVKTFIAVCAPFDLAQSVRSIQEKRNRFYHFYYLQKIRKQASPWAAQNIRTLHEFDNLIIAPLWGYKGASEYYHECSSIRFLPKIQQATHLLFAEDDPFICFDRVREVSLPHAVHLWSAEQGGHMGFLARRPYWMYDLLLNWVEEDFRSNQ